MIYIMDDGVDVLTRLHELNYETKIGLCNGPAQGL